jgi:hypothetical protein
VQAFGLGLARGLEDLQKDRAIDVLALRLGPRVAVRLQSTQDLSFIDGRAATSRALRDSILRNRGVRVSGHGLYNKVFTCPRFSISEKDLDF